jgi:hypothetical protein
MSLAADAPWVILALTHPTPTKILKRPLGEPGLWFTHPCPPPLGELRTFECWKSRPAVEAFKQATGIGSNVTL